MYLADSAVVISLKWKLTKKLLQGPMLSPVQMPGTLTRNNWKQKHSKPLKWLSLRSASEITVLEEIETTEQTEHAIHRVKDKPCFTQDSQRCTGKDIPGVWVETHLKGEDVTEGEGAARVTGCRAPSVQSAALGRVQVCNRHRSTSRWLSTTSLK